MAVPQRRVTNVDLSRTVDTSDAWIRERTGIVERRVAGEGETTASLAIEAGLAAIKDAGIDSSDIGLCIVATCTSEQPIPPTSSFVQEGLGLRCGAFDVDAACSGFVYAMVAGASMVATGACGPVLVVGSEMCIRDRPGTWAATVHSPGCSAFPPAAAASRPRRPPWPLATTGLSLIHI